MSEETLVIARKTYRGKRYVDLRLHFRARGGDQLHPTPKGATIRDAEVPALMVALRRVLDGA